LNTENKLETLNGVPKISSLKDNNGLSYFAFRQKLKPMFYKVWLQMMLCLLMMFLPILFFLETVNSSTAIILIPLCSLWSAYWIHAYGCFFHEAAHFNIHKNKIMNDIIANLLLSPFLGMLVKNYRLSHWEHHKHLGTVKDTEISYMSSLSATNLLQVVTGVYHVKIILRYVQNFKTVGSQAQKKSISTIFLITLLLTIIVQVIISLLMLMYVSVAAGLSWIIAYFFLYPMLAKIRQTLEHRRLDENAPIRAMECQAVNRLFGNNFFSRYFGAAGFNRHLLHHYDPSISYTNFDELELFLKNTPIAEELDAKRSTYKVIFGKLLKR
jgi:fatty acid desaturase